MSVILYMDVIGLEREHLVPIATEFCGNQLHMYRLDHKLAHRGFRLCSVQTSLISCSVPSSSYVCWSEAWLRVHWLCWVCTNLLKIHKKFMVRQAQFSHILCSFSWAIRWCIDHADRSRHSKMFQMFVWAWRPSWAWWPSCAWQYWWSHTYTAYPCLTS